ncbi:MAG: hypothetical protein V3R95_10400 [Dehalococcoidia bacterium]
MIASLTTSRPFTVTRPLARDLLVALGTGLGVAMAKLLFDFHLGIPGHGGVGWVAVLIAGSAFGRPGVGAAAGLSVGLWGLPLGLGHSMGYNALLYASAGAALDFVRLARPLRLSNPIGAATAGLAVHMTKLGFIVVYAGSLGMIKNIHFFGLGPVALNHALFGIAGGLLGWVAIRAARASRGGRGLRPSS